MKSRRRHDLKQNVLDAELGRLVAFFKKRGTYIVWGVLAAALVALIIWYTRGQHSRRVTEIRSTYERLVMLHHNPSAEAEVLVGFQELAAQDKIKRIAADACVRIGSIYARQAMASELDLERAELFSRAKSQYLRAIDSFPDESLAVAKAHFGLAKLAESRRDFPAARTSYQAVLQTAQVRGYPVAIMAEAALRGLSELEAPVRMATTLPSTQPTTAEAATAPSTRPAATMPSTAPAPKGPVEDSRKP